MSHHTWRKALVVGVAGLTATLGLAACGDDSDGGSGGDVAVTLITKTDTNPFFVAMAEGAKEAGKDEGVSITTAAGKEDGDTDGQIAAIEDAIARGDAGILITPSGPEVNSAIKKARDAGLYVIALDTPPDPPDTVDITFATDNFQAGELIGQWTKAQLAGSSGDDRAARPVQRQGGLGRLRPRPGLPDRHGHRHRRPEGQR